eukprot:4336853-Prymnesium_polylepis.1
MQGNAPHGKRAPTRTSHRSKKRGTLHNAAHLLANQRGTCRRDGSLIHTLQSVATVQTRRKQFVDQVRQRRSQKARGRQDEARKRVSEVHGHLAYLAA